jgi:peptidoglycan hydrolase-like protein with peptidoglycan-binding domain
MRRDKDSTPGTSRPGTGRHLRPSWARHYRAAFVAAGVVALLASGGLVASSVLSATRVSKQGLLASGERQGLGGPAATTSAPAVSTTTTVPATTTTTLPPLPEVGSVTPRQGATGVAPNAPIVVTLSAPPLPGSPMPEVTPAVAGSWSVAGSTLTFTPSSDWAPWSTEKVTIPAKLATPEQVSFQVAGVPLLRVQQLLAELRYLPLRFGPTSAQSALPSEPTVPTEISRSPQPGVFTWRFSNIPSTLSSQWVPGQQTVVTQGAVMQFEYVNGLAIDGIAGPKVWAALTTAVAERKFDPYPYDYLMVSETLPESLTVWRQGKDIYQTPVNTGVPGANTPVGTWPVYEHVQFSDMQGTDVNGYHYNVPNVPWDAYFYDGDAVHGYWRASYGYPQSNGCVELPVANAAVVWPMDPIGTLVNVSA